MITEAQRLTDSIPLDDKVVAELHESGTPFQIYQTKDKPIVLIAFLDHHWQSFCQVVGKEEWIGHERYGTNGLRLKHYEDFNREMNALMASRTYDEWAALFAARDVIHGPVNTMEDLARDPRLRAREMIVELDHPQVGKHGLAGNPIKLSRTRVVIDKAAPLLGADTEDILSSRLGLSGEEILKLKESGIV